MKENNLEINQTKNIEGALLFQLVCSLNSSKYYNDERFENTVDFAQRQLNQIKEKGYDLVEVYCELKEMV